MVWIYDIEIYINYFSAIFKNPETKEIKKFVIFNEKNDLSDLLEFIENKWLIGYNNYSFDNQLLGFLYYNQLDLSQYDSDYICSQILQIAKNIISDRSYDNYKYNIPFKSLDLMKIGGFYKSLKLIGVNLKWHKLQDLPIKWSSKIKQEDLDLMLKYNLNDVEITEKLYFKLLPQIKMRFQISEKYNIKAHSEPESGIANKLLEKFYSESTGLHPKEFKDSKTNRKLIQFNNVVSPFIKFETNELNELLESVSTFTWFESKPFFKKSVIFDGIKYQLGVGGLHSLDEGAMFEESEDEYIIDADIGSYYPNLIINQNIYPAHLDNKFIKKYREIKDIRLEHKHKGNTVDAGALKIVLNSTFGKMLFKKHWLYDPLAGYRITVNGQLFLLMLIEQLVLNGFKVISANTDGIVSIVKKNKIDLYYKICKEWEEKTKFDLEYTFYNKYIRKDVNNYLCITKDNKIKSKGIFTVPDVDSKDNRQVLESLAKGFDKPIISIALYNYFINNISFEETVKNHKDIYDFCIAKKIDDKFANEFHYFKDNEKIIEELQKSVRFYISKDGGKLYKSKEENNKKLYTDYLVGRRVSILNNIDDNKPIEDYNIDYDYYLSELYKIFYKIKSLQLKLF